MSYGDRFRRIALAATLLLVPPAAARAAELAVEVEGAALAGSPLHLAVAVPAAAAPGPYTVSVDGAAVHVVELGPGEHALRLEQVRLPAGPHTVAVAGPGGRGEVAARGIPGWLSLLPPLLAIGLALAFRDVILSLYLGVFTGALILAGGNPVTAFARSVDHFLRGALADADHAAIIVFSLLLGGMVGVISRSGGTHGIVARLAGWATSARRGQLATWAMGMAIFFDDYANTLIVGPTMRPITDRLRISREKLAYAVDSTAAPVASLVPISTWVGYEVGLIGDALQSVDITANPYAVFVATIPYRFYPILALVMVFAVALWGRDFGPMLRAERRARSTGEVLGEGQVPLGDFGNQALTPPPGLDPRARTAVLPILTVVTVTIGGLLVSGAGGVDPGTSGLAWLRQAFANADSYAALLWASLAGVLVAVGLAALEPKLRLSATMSALMEGCKSMLLAMVVLVLAWSLGAVTSELHTGDYLVSITEGVLSPHLVPVLVFALAAAIAFATGTSWATMAILFPLVVPVIHRLAPGDGGLLLGTISSVLAGSVWGDHCSPISDTTILSSMATGCDHIAHVRTQMPYALAVGALGMAVGDIPTAWGMSPWVSLAVGGAVVVGGVRWLGRPPGDPGS
ncbi:MAG TPA: Na+/H+ antiporter NhaC family protein [Thermoanaerobaculia bacterium]|nr:Na+/H+ antiporter NhaC family protein [Thermoanaerobaculia bacterium]